MQKKKWQFRYLLIWCQILLSLWITSCSVPSPSAPEVTVNATALTGNLTVHFLDVGEGNATLVESDGKYMLIDGGVNAKSSYVVAYLKKQGIESFEYVIATHYDADHLAGIVGVLHVFPIQTILGPNYSAETKIYRSFIEQIALHDYTVITPQVGASYQLGEASFTIVGPVRYGHIDVNDDSIAIRLEYGQTSFLIAGDAGAESEMEMVESGVGLKSDVYLVNHHGSETSTTQSFLDLVDPDYAVISSSTAGNNYGHPREAVLNRLQQNNTELFRTDRQGEILISSDGLNLSFSQPPCNDFIAGENGEGQTPRPVLSSENEAAANYILNTNSNKFHRLDCQAVEKMKEENKDYFYGSREEVIALGFDPCGWCLP